ncbi:MAG: hypothetical protein Q4C43_09815 [Prevotella sp.]|nr:hypothetical protein [Prevotella sp.]
MIKFYETREEMLEAFKKSVALRKVWEDLTSGRMTFEDFKKQLQHSNNGGMIQISLSNINLRAEYHVTSPENGLFVFTTVQGKTYKIGFIQD